jgi:hypothetical protein
MNYLFLAKPHNDAPAAISCLTVPLLNFIDRHGFNLGATFKYFNNP